MSDAKQPDSPEFYDRHWEHADTARDPHVVAKGELVTRMIPEGIRTIVDVGCGDGYLTHKLAERWDVTGVDRSPVALQRLRCRAVQASADELPFEDRSFDMLFSSQMLEHLHQVNHIERVIRIRNIRALHHPYIKAQFLAYDNCLLRQFYAAYLESPSFELKHVDSTAAAKVQDHVVWSHPNKVPRVNIASQDVH